MAIWPGSSTPGRSLKAWQWQAPGPDRRTGRRSKAARRHQDGHTTTVPLGAGGRRSARPLTRMRSPVARLVLTQEQGAYLPSWSAKLPLWVEKTGEEKRLWRRFCKQKACQAGGWAWRCGPALGWSQHPCGASGPNPNTPGGRQRGLGPPSGPSLASSKQNDLNQ